MEEQEILTVSEALKLGYTTYGYENRDFQHTMKIQNLKPIDFEDGKLLLFGIEPSFVPNIDAETISELIAYHVYSQNGDNTNDDTNDVYDSVKEIDFSSIVDVVNEKLQKHKYYNFTNIQLIQD